MSRKLEQFYTIDNIVEIEIEINKSRFISRVYPVTSVEEVNAVLQAVRKEHYKANHVCFAYVLAQEPVTLKAGDDGEPSGTAGRPILNVIQKQGLSDVLVLVIRYFGGIKLGKGGLVRAYSEAATKAVSKTKRLWVAENDIISIETEYSFYQGLKLELEKHNIRPVTEEFSDMVKLTFEIPVELTDWFIQRIKDFTNNNYLDEIVETKLVKKTPEQAKIIK